MNILKPEKPKGVAALLKIYKNNVYSTYIHTSMADIYGGLYRVQVYVAFSRRGRQRPHLQTSYDPDTTYIASSTRINASIHTSVKGTLNLTFPQNVPNLVMVRSPQSTISYRYIQTVTPVFHRGRQSFGGNNSHVWQMFVLRFYIIKTNFV